MNEKLQDPGRPGGMIAPLLVLVLFLGLLAALLHLPVPLPIGPHYWELSAFLDAAHRIAAGQLQAIDFSAPAGPLAYHLYALATPWVPDAHPLLVAQWAILALHAPLMALILIDVAPRSRATGWALLLPFLLFAALPFNLAESHAGPGMDAYGIAARQSAHLLYLLAAALIFVRNPFLLALVAGIALTGLFLLKIGAFLAGALVFAYAILAGRMRWSVLLAILVIFYGALGWAEYSAGFVSAYLQDAIHNLQDSGQGIAAGLIAALAARSALVGLVVLLLITILWFGRGRFGYIYSENVTYLGRRRAIHAIFNSPMAWIVALAVAAILLESRSPDSHGVLLLWPAVWLMLLGLDRFPVGRRFAIAALGAAIVLPGLVLLLQRAAETAIAAPAQLALTHERLGRIGLASADPARIARADILREHQMRHRRAYLALAEQGELPSPELYAGLDFQIAWLQELDLLLTAIETWEAENDRKLSSVHLAERVNPLPALLGREPLRHARIGAEIGHEYQRDRMQWLQQLGEAEGILLPHCPETADRLAARARILPALEGRQAIAITPCHTLMLKRESGGQAGEPAS